MALWVGGTRMHAVAKYLRTYAEPEIGLAERTDGEYERALVVPVHHEEPRFVDGLAGAARTSHGRTLAIVVVNASDDALTITRAFESD